MERPLGGLERRYWLLGKVAPLTPALVLRFRGAPNPAALRRGLAAATRRQWFLRVRVDERPSGPVFVEGAPPVPLEVVARQGADHWRAVLGEALNAPFPTWPGPLQRVHLLQGSDAAELLLTYHHVSMDGLGSVEAARDALRFADEAARGEAPAPAPLPPPDPLGDLMPPEANGPAGQAALAEAVARFQAVKAASPARFAPERAAPPAERRTRVQHRTLDEPALSALAAKARAEGATVHAALCAAAYLSAADELGLDAPRVLGLSTPANLREQLARAPREGVAWYAFGLPMFHAVARGGGLWDLARRVRDELHDPALRLRRLAVLAHIEEATARTADGAAQEAQGAEDFGVTTLSVTNVGRIAPLPAVPGAEVASVGICSPMNLGGAILGLAAATYGGQLALNVSHPEPLIGAARAARLADGVVDRLR